MTDTTQEIGRGQQAAELLEHPLLVEAFEMMRSQYLSAWESSPARDAQGREELWRLLKSLSAVEGHLKTVVETGKMARLQMEQESRAKQLRDGVLSRLGF
jgi:hypothetical protein